MKSIVIRKLPSMNATQRAIAVAFSWSPVSTRTLQRAFATLTVVLDHQRLGRLPPTWDTGSTCFAKGWAIHNAEQALTEIEAKLGEIDFDVDFSMGPQHQQLPLPQKLS